EDSRGRHTTTHRELIQLPGGGLVMDTPGMREMQLWASAEDVARAFQDVETLAEKCNFSDCSHTSEPGCAVQEAISSGRLNPDRLFSYQKLMLEQRQFEKRQNSNLMRETKAERRRRAKLYKRRPTKME
ncbi:MAG: ribosome small subunit-dependent GTPase, partial [Gammaproteobacteria bacterium]|nr:ribosome small subunit-dependent GTPase [Gammaproteobacteria bacterium]